jgi:hypothetical protein
MAWTRPFDRGHGRCSVRGQRLTVTGTPEPRDRSERQHPAAPWSTGRGGYPGLPRPPEGGCSRVGCGVQQSEGPILALADRQLRGRHGR